MAYRDVIEALERAGCDPQGSGHKHKARCPNHRGKGRSLSVALQGDKTLVTCWAKGCSFKSITAALSLSEGVFFETERLPGGRYPVSQRQKEGKMGKKDGFDEPTLEQMAEKSGVSVEHLELMGWQFGVAECERRDGSKYAVTGCRVPYYKHACEGEESKSLNGVQVVETFAKIRASLDGDPKYLHEKPGSPGLYGEWLLDGYRARKEPVLIFVEGETDPVACVSQRLPAVGVPGVDLVSKVVKAEHLEGFERLFIIREPGDSGLKFCQNFAKHLPLIGWTGPVRVVELPEKDPAAMLKALGPVDFLPAFREAVKAGYGLDKVSQSEEINSLIQWGDKIEMQPVRYLMYPWLPIGGGGKLTLLCGEAGLGKSYTMMAISAKVSKGEVMEGCDPERSEPGEGRVLVFSGEDQLEETLAPRLTVCGGDRSKMAVYNTRKRRVTFEDIDHLKKVVVQVKPSLIFFDPISRFWPAGVSMNDQDTVAPLLEPICELGAGYGAAVVLVGWSPKGDKSNAMASVFGSVAWSGSARSVLIVSAADDDDPTGGTRRGLISQAKANHAAVGRSIKYEIGQERVELPAGVQEDSIEAEAIRRAGSFRWLGIVNVTADQAVSGRSSGARRLAQTASVLRTVLEGRDGVPVNEVFEALKVSHDVYWDARMEVGVIEKKGPGCQLLFLPGENQQEDQGEFGW